MGGNGTKWEEIQDIRKIMVRGCAEGLNLGGGQRPPSLMYVEHTENLLLTENRKVQNVWKSLISVQKWTWGLL